jgi:cell division septation protein DedD
MAKRSTCITRIIAPLALALPLLSTPLRAQNADSIMTARAEEAMVRMRRYSASDMGAARMLADSLVASLPLNATIFAEVLFAKAAIAPSAFAAERDYKRIVNEFRFAPRVPDALMRLALLESARNNRSGALRYLDRLLRDHTDAPMRSRAALLAGRLRMEGSDPARACELLAAAYASAGLTERDVRAQADSLGTSCPTPVAVMALRDPPPLGIKRATGTEQTASAPVAVAVSQTRRLRRDSVITPTRVPPPPSVPASSAPVPTPQTATTPAVRAPAPSAPTLTVRRDTAVATAATTTVVRRDTARTAVVAAPVLRRDTAPVRAPAVVAATPPQAPVVRRDTARTSVAAAQIVRRDSAPIQTPVAVTAAPAPRPRPSSSAPVTPAPTLVPAATSPAGAAPTARSPATTPMPAPTAPAAPTPAPVVRTPTPTTTPTTTPTPAPVASGTNSSARFGVQFAAYNDRPGAEQFASVLRSRGITARVEGTEKPFRVRAGRFTTRAEAEASAALWRRPGQPAIVVPLSPAP